MEEAAVEAARVVGARVVARGGAKVGAKVEVMAVGARVVEVRAEAGTAEPVLGE